MSLQELGNSGTPIQVAEKLKLVGVSTVPLKPSDVAQVMDTLVYEGWIDYEGAARRRKIQLHKLEMAEFSNRKKLVSEFDKKPKGKGKHQCECAACASVRSAYPQRIVVVRKRTFEALSWGTVTAPVSGRCTTVMGLHGSCTDTTVCTTEASLRLPSEFARMRNTNYLNTPS